MRPVKKGNKLRTYKEYTHARSDLINKIGEYCSYCERYIPANLAVEHVKPKDPHKYLELEWENFLLACVNCNSTKGTQDVKLNDYYWPHMDNTLIPFVYSSTGLVGIRAHLSSQHYKMADNTLKLTGLNKKTPDKDKTVSNRLWKHRKETWKIAEKQLNRLESVPVEYQSILIDTILPSSNTGFFSIWLTVFRNYPEMIDKLINKFTGTAITKNTLNLERDDYRSLL